MARLCRFLLCVATDLHLAVAACMSLPTPSLRVVLRQGCSTHARQRLRQLHDVLPPPPRRRPRPPAPQVMPSMRSMMTAGGALAKCHISGYNCSYLPIDHPFAFDETLFILMNGTGVGFSVEQDCVAKLPLVAER